MNKKIRFSLLTLLVMLCGTVFATKTVYIDPVGDGTWLGDNAKISVNVYTDGQSNNTFVTPTVYEGNVLKVTFEDSYDRMIIVRGENQDAWGWNQTENITPVDNTLYKANGYNNDQLAYTTVYPYITAPAAGYTVDFNTAITTSSHDFAVASKWKHIVQDNDGYYVGYKWDAAYGTGDPATGGLLVYSQKVGSSSWDMATVYDLLVTPKVSGTIKLKVKAYENASSSTKAFVQLWSVNGSATEKDTQLKEFQTEIPGYSTGSGEWVELTYDVAEAQRIGIRAQYVYIDDFSADVIDTTPEAALTVSSVMNSTGQTGTQGTNPQFEQQADGNMKVVLKVTLSNTGDVDFVAGTTENYTLTVGQASYTSGDKTYYADASIAIPENIAVGESKTFDVEFTIPYISGYKYWYVKENVTGTTSTSYRYATSVAYESKFILRVAESGSTSDLTTAQAFGRISAAETRSFEIYNDGTAPLVIKSITLPEGFTSDNLPVIPEGGLELAKKTATAAFNVTLPVTTTGDFVGNLVIKYVKAGDENETTKELAFSGTVLAEGTWFADFNGDASSSTSGVYPAGSVVTSSTGLQFGYTGSYGSYDQYLKPYSSAGTLVMPKLTATAGAQLKYDAVRYQSGNSYYLKVYVSTDRKTWGEAKATINNSDLESTGRYTQTLTFDEAGDYYVAFELYGVGLDNVIGLTKTTVAHDIYIKETTLVAEAQTGKVIKPSVKVLPLTDEAADGYTVKYYVDGVAVATAESVELTSSATADKTFTISYTPNDEVTTEHDTYIEFEFADGTKIATEHQTLKVTNEPKFLFVAASTSVGQYTTNLTTAQAFGKTNDATSSKTFKIYNQGTAPLNITSIVAPEGFSVNKTEAFAVAAGESEDIIVTFSAATPGEYAGNLVVTYTQEGAEPYTLAFSGTMLDSNKWYANFDNASTNEIVWPAGSVYESNINTSYSGYSAPYNYYIYSRSSSNNKFTTPKLTAAAGDVFHFDACAYSSYYSNGTIKVYASATRTELGEAIAELSVTDYSNWATQDVTITTAGDYYITLEFENVKIDELYGLAPAAVAHDLKIASSSVPTEAMQNNTVTASVNVQNFGLAADEATVTAYVGGEAIATSAAVAIPMNHKLTDAGTQLSVNFVYPKAGENVPVYLEVKAGETIIADTDPVNVTFAEEEAKSDAEMTSGGTSNTSLLHMNWNNSESVSLYSKDVLTEMGLNGGEKISSITFKGYNSGSKNYSTNINVWYEFTDDQTQTTPSVGKYDTSSMTNVLSTERSWASAEGSSSEMVELIKVTFAEPITYPANKSLRLVVCSEGTQYQSGTNFEISTISGTNTSYYNRNDNQSTFTNSQSWSANSKLPAIHIALVAESATLAGTVKTSGRTAIEGATVTLKAENGVEYSGTTNAAGEYSFNVIQADLDFTVTVEAEGYLKKEFAYNLGGESKTLNTTLYQSYGIVGTGLAGFTWDDDKVMTQSDEDPNIFTLVVPNVEVAEANTTLLYKLRADGIWQNNETNDGYQVPSDNTNNNYVFTVADTYTLTFTANVAEHTLTLSAESNTLKNAIELAKDDDAVAVGKLRAAIENNPEDMAALQAAVNQFKADNAESGIDFTEKVGKTTDKWVNAQNCPAGEFKIYNGNGVDLVQVFGVTGEGNVLTQEVEVENGLYNIGLYATSHNAWNGQYGTNAAGKPTLQEDADDVAYVFGTSGENTVKTWITARRNSGLVESEPVLYAVNGVEVTNGKLTMGLALAQAAKTEWHSIQIASLKKITTAKMAYAAVKANMTAEITAAKAMKNDYRIAGLDDFNAAIETAEATLTSNMLNVTEFEAEVATLKAAEAAFRAANYVAINGTFYVQNVASGKFMAAGHSYGTRGIVNATGLDLTLKANENKTVDIDSRVSNGGNSHFLGNGLYMDSDSWGWIIEKAGEDVYTIGNGTQFIGVDAEDNLVLQDAAATWKFLVAADVDRERMTAGMAALEAATAENGVDATFLIKANNFNRNDARNAEAWTVSDDCTNKNLGGGCSGTEGNGCAESWHSAFTIMQTISGAPAGIYKMTAQGFYGQDAYEGEVPAAPMFFANGVNKNVPAMGELPDYDGNNKPGMGDASTAFTKGNYAIEPIEFEVKEDGMMYVGITASANTQWVCWDNFQLTYYGPAPVIAGDVDDDGTVDVADVTMVVDFAIESKVPTARQKEAADVVKDDAINVADVVGVVGIALNWGEPVTTDPEAAGARIFSAADNFLKLNGSEIDLQNETEFVAFQMDVTLAEGAVLRDVQLTDRAADHVVAYNRVGENTYRVLAYSISKQAFNATNGAIVKLDILGDNQVAVDAAMFVDLNAHSYMLGVKDATGIRGISADQLNSDIYTMGGVKSNKVRKGLNVIRNNNGKVVKQYVK